MLDAPVEEPILRGESNGIGVLPDLLALLAFVVAILAMQSVLAPKRMLALAKGVAQRRRSVLSRMAGFAAASNKAMRVPPSGLA